MNPDGTGKTWKRDLPKWIESFTWSPRGNTYAYDDPRVGEVIIDDFNVSARLAKGANPTWAPDGASILFNDGSYLQSEINRDGSGLHVMPGNYYVHDAKSAISPGWDCRCGAHICSTQ